MVEKYQAALKTKEELALVKFLSSEVLNPICYIDIHLFKTILVKKSLTIEEYKNFYFNETKYMLSDSIFNHSINVINGLFVTEKHNKNLVKIGINRNYELIILKDNIITIGKTLNLLISNKDVYSSLLDLCCYSILKLKEIGTETFNNDFVLNQRYSSQPLKTTLFKKSKV